MPQTLAFSSSLETLRFSVHNTFETRLLLKIFDAEFPYKLSYFESLCLPAKMAAETVIRPIESRFYRSARSGLPRQVLAQCLIDVSIQTPRQIEIIEFGAVKARCLKTRPKGLQNPVQKVRRAQHLETEPENKMFL